MARKDKQKDLEIKRLYSRKYYKNPINKAKHEIQAKAWYLRNREKMRQYSYEYWSKPENKLKNRNSHFKNNYGISVEIYEELLKSQNGVCAICGNKCTTKKNLSVDHDHLTKKVRGLFCHKCNTGLGYVNDDVKILQKMIEYLNKPQI